MIDFVILPEQGWDVFRRVFAVNNREKVNRKM